MLNPYPSTGRANDEVKRLTYVRWKVWVAGNEPAELLVLDAELLPVLVSDDVQIGCIFAWRNQLTSWRMENLRPRIERGPSHVILSIPTIPIFAAFALAWAAVHLRDRRMVSNPCPRCQYSLAGLPPGAACPECGHVVLG